MCIAPNADEFWNFGSCFSCRFAPIGAVSAGCDSTVPRKCPRQKAWTIWKNCKGPRRYGAAMTKLFVKPSPQLTSLQRDPPP